MLRELRQYADADGGLAVRARRATRRGTLLLIAGSRRAYERALVLAMLATGQMEQDRYSCGDDVGSAARRGGRHYIQMMMQEAVMQPVRCRHPDQYHDLLGALLAGQVGEC